MATLSEQFLSALDVSVTELAALRGVSRQYATRDLENFLGSQNGLTDLCRTLLVINTDSSRTMAAKLKAFAKEQLGFEISIGTDVATATSKSYAQLLAESTELWIWAESPIEIERSEHWDSLRSEFLDHPDRLLVFFVPSLEVADRLAGRFETELFSRQYDSDGKGIPHAKPFGATVFIIATNLAAATPYFVLSNPGSSDLAKTLSVTAWSLGKAGEDFFELPSRFAHELVQKARAAGLGVARSRDNFFPIGQSLRDAGLPLRNYKNIDYSIFAIKLDHAIGLFEGEVTSRLDVGQVHEQLETAEEIRDDSLPPHPLKFFPVFIRAYRKKAGELSKIPPPRKKERIFFKFS